uniref:Uncharacterized protein TCIL3000_3_2480 n=1 Tax=Trypanosoma congolense (strain IL3000) TaxID=1068625 RepID=G0UKB0_TRYCI|nr:unnamed protein product [Trypanosoma congolense IL3000]
MNTEQYGYNKIAVFEALNVQVVLAVMDTQLECHRGKTPIFAIGFRGTTNLSNARENLRMRQRRWREVNNERKGWSITRSAKVHSGFLNIWISLKLAVLHTLQTFLTTHSSVVYRVLCTGHSLGGAVASLCAYSVRRMLRQIKYPLSEVTVYTFGQPAIGNSAFRSAYDKAVPRTFRVVNESDAVSLFSLFGGTHVGVEVDIDRHGNYICKPTFIERLFRPTRGTGFALQNHTLSAYAESLNALADCNGAGACRVRCRRPYVQNASTRANSVVKTDADTTSTV